MVFSSGIDKMVKVWKPAGLVGAESSHGLRELDLTTAGMVAEDVAPPPRSSGRGGGWGHGGVDAVGLEQLSVRRSCIGELVRVLKKTTAPHDEDDLSKTICGAARRDAVAGLHLLHEDSPCRSGR